VPSGQRSEIDQSRAPASGKWRYVMTGHARTRLIIAALGSAAIHAAAFLFIGPTKEPGPRKIVNETPLIALTMVKIEDLDEPERVPTDSDAPIDPAVLVPMQADVPQLATISDFVQKIDFNSLVERPDMSAAKVFAIPDNIDRGAGIRQSIGAVFNLADLDRIPEPLVRPPPIFPNQFKHDVVTATVRVQFIVDTNGGVVNPIVVESTHSGFNEPAVVGVAKWRFKPGVKGGRRVNTRMEVPIVFKITDE
jgi:protein TonB